MMSYAMPGAHPDTQYFARGTAHVDYEKLFEVHHTGMAERKNLCSPTNPTYRYGRVEHIARL